MCGLACPYFFTDRAYFLILYAPVCIFLEQEMAKMVASKHSGNCTLALLSCDFLTISNIAG